MIVPGRPADSFKFSGFMNFSGCRIDLGLMAFSFCSSVTTGNGLDLPKVFTDSWACDTCSSVRVVFRENMESTVSRSFGCSSSRMRCNAPLASRPRGCRIQAASGALRPELPCWLLPRFAHLPQASLVPQSPAGCAALPYILVFSWFGPAMACPFILAALLSLRATMALTMVAGFRFHRADYVLGGKQNFRERMASPSAVVWAFTICTVCSRFIVSIPLIVLAVAATGKCLGGDCQKNCQKSSFFIFGPLFHGLFHKLRSQPFHQSPCSSLNSAASALNFRLCGAAGKSGSKPAQGFRRPKAQIKLVANGCIFSSDGECP